MALTFSGASGVNSATIPSHAAGDLIIAFAYRDGNVGSPGVPAGENWTPLHTANGANSNSHTVVAKTAASSSETTGSFSNATSIIVVVVKTDISGGLLGYKNGATGSGASTTLSFTGFTLDNPYSSSRVMLFAGHRSTNTTIDAAPTNFTNITSVLDGTDEAAAHRSTNLLSTFSTITRSVGGTSSGWRTHTLEVYDYKPPFETTGSLTGGDAEISGSASRAAGTVNHATTGTLENTGATLSGSSARFRAFATSGVLNTTGAVIVGSSARISSTTEHETSGALESGASVIVASGERYRVFSASGTLANSGAVISASSERFRTFATSGALQGDSAVLSGSARHNIPHDAIGVLEASGASVTGNASRLRAFASSGALVGDGSTVTGDAELQIPAGEHGAIGVLQGSGAALSGNASRLRDFISTGAIESSDSIVIGNASRTRLHEIDGALIGQSSIVVGSVLRFRAFASSGNLIGDDAEILGDADRVQGEIIVHGSSGALVCDGAIIVGTDRAIKQYPLAGIAQSRPINQSQTISTRWHCSIAAYKSITNKATRWH